MLNTWNYIHEPPPRLPLRYYSRAEVTT